MKNLQMNIPKFIQGNSEVDCYKIKNVLIFFILSIFCLGNPIAAQNTITITSSVNSHYCVGDEFDVSYTTTGYFDFFSTYSVELSDLIGSFSNPVSLCSIGYLSLYGAASGTIHITIPLIQPLGSNYRIRVTSSDPPFAGSDNGSDITFTSLSITNNLNNHYCAGAGFSVSYLASGNFTGSNVFNVELSDLIGNFPNPIIIGSSISNSTSGNIPVTLPANLTPGGKYRIRVTASNPYQEGNDNGSDITIDEFPGAVTAWNDGPVCEGQPVNILSNVDSCHGIQAFDGSDRWFRYLIFYDWDVYLFGPGLYESPFCNPVDGHFIVDYCHPRGDTGIVIESSGDYASTIYGVDSPFVYPWGASSNPTINILPGYSYIIYCELTNEIPRGFSYAWTGPPGFSSNIQNTNYTNAAGTYNFNVTVIDNNGCTSTANTTAEINPLPAATASYNSTLCEGDTLHLFADGGTLYEWSGPGITSSNSHDQNPSIPNVTIANHGIFTITVTDANGCTSTASLTITEPAQKDDGDACTIDACNPSTGIVTHTLIDYFDNDLCTDDFCDSITGQITHFNNPVIPSLATGTIACNGGTTSVTVNATGGLPPYIGTDTFPNYSGGTYLFEVTDSRGCTTSDSVTINEPSKILIAFSNVVNTGCLGNSGSAKANPSGGTPGYTYLWTPGTQTTQTADSLSAGTYTVKVTDYNGCTATATVVILSSGGGLPPAPGAISGPVGMCLGQCATYSIAAVPGATSYLWTLPSGLTGISTTTSITVCASIHFCQSTPSGFICVKAVNSCGAGLKTCKNIKLFKNKPSSPVCINGPSVICRGACATYTIASVTDATSYVWSTTGGLTISSGQSTNTVVVCALANSSNCSQIKVYAKNCKGNSSTKYKNIIVNNAPAQPGIISGYTSVCRSNINKHYSISFVSGAASYMWSATNGVVITSGQGTKDAYLNFGGSGTAASTIISVVAVNSCGNSIARTKTTTISNCKLAASADYNGTTGISISSLKAFPIPTSGLLTVTFFTETKSKFNLKVTDMLGNVMVSEMVTSVEGENKNTINLSHIAKGMYFLNLEMEAVKIQSIRIIVE